MFIKRKKDNISVPDTLIASNVEVRGDVQFTGGIQIEGKVYGNLEAVSGKAAKVWLTEKGKVTGQITAPNVAVNGVVEGDVYSSARLILSNSAKILGNVYYHCLEMEEGAEVNGMLSKREENVTELSGASKVTISDTILDTKKAEKKVK